MGFLDFLKAKKGGKKEEALEPLQSFQPFPPLPSEPEMYSELPNLPEAPETSGLPEIELPPTLKGLDDFDFPEGMGEEAGKGKGKGKEPTQRFTEMPSSGTQYKMPAEPLIPEWPKASETKLPELPTMPEQPEEKPWDNIPADVPELRTREPEHQPGLRGSLVSHKSGFFLKAEDFRMVKDDIDAMIKAQKKHHRLTEIKKEENSHYEQMSIMIEDAQRKLMHIDRTLFE